MKRNLSNLVIGPHYVYCVIGTDGSFISDTYWWKEHADDYRPSGCRVERFRLVLDPKRKKQKKPARKKGTAVK